MSNSNLSMGQFPNRTDGLRVGSFLAQTASLIASPTLADYTTVKTRQEDQVDRFMRLNFDEAGITGGTTIMTVTWDCTEFRMHGSPEQTPMRAESASRRKLSSSSTTPL